MDEEERRKRARRTALNELEEERVFPAESESHSEEETTASTDEEDFEYTDSSVDEPEYRYSENQSDELGFLDDVNYDSISSYQDMEEDDIDPDELSYEELIELGENVGVESKGLSENEISKYLKPFTYQLSTADFTIQRCVICQMEYEEDEKIVSLRCNHLYHLHCVSKWLHIKKICPVCGIDITQ